MAITVCLLPFLTIAGPGHTAPADVTMAASIVCAALWVSSRRIAVRIPYAWGVGGLLLGGALAATVSAAPPGVAIVLVQDMMLLLWAAVLALGSQDAAILKAATRAWGLSATAYASVMVAAYLLGINALTGVTATEGIRASYTFGDPNLAANYLILSLFVMAACKQPRSTTLRGFGYLMITAAVMFTASNGAMVTILVAGVVAVSLSRLRSSGPASAVLVAAGLATVSVLLIGYVRPLIDVTEIRENAASSIPLLRDSLGRSGSSVDERATIVKQGMRLFLDGDATGFGPARTKATFRADQAPYDREAHNDYLATLIERGVVGAVGLLLLVVTTAVYCGRVAVRALPPAYAEIVPRAWYLAAIAPGLAVSGLFYEVLHFRHLWTWLGLVAALALVLRQSQPVVRERKVPR
ncbi:MAG TPA: O-antigen ligase family protein [Nocardioidaceae bacterium]|nr:O-antigen ligase family protein [Nocardioidaceae bacterium]